MDVQKYVEKHSKRLKSKLLPSDITKGMLQHEGDTPVKWWKRQDKKNTENDVGSIIFSIWSITLNTNTINQHRYDKSMLISIYYYL